ncbi:PREDICTED: uncharacterized protein LOC109172301 [Ipomoea nil]|uniref:uncharacterized protein LOC109172301 n=1 Tax=Ipomoea nil TaxID=35883 RepID=UPI000901C062|nr:PREDICTED: uncharacterized protein LOC109172301 [Ipomoea nil]
MEDRNALAADCIVISCCCQCLILQVIIFILLRLPSRIIRKTKRYVKRRLRSRKRAEKVVQIELCGYGDESSRRRGGSPDDGFPFSDSSFGCCMDEVERVLEEFSQKGEFAFGSFWGGDVSKRVFSYCQPKQEVVDYDCFHHHLIETFGSFNFKQ